MHNVVRAGLVAGALFAGALGSAQAQSFPGLGGIGLRVGTYSPDNANSGFGGTAEADLGYLRWPNVRVLLGYTYFNADVEREISGTPLDGSISAQTGKIGVRLDLFSGARLSPYVGVALSGHSVSASASDAADQDLLDGVYDGFFVGTAASAGLAFALDTARRFAVTGEVRQVFVTKISHTAYELGIRFTPRGRGAYSNTRELQRRALREEADRVAREREMERMAAAAALSRADSLRAAQEAERFRVQRAREDSSRMAMDQASRDEAERQRLAREREAERQRQQAAAQLAQSQSQSEIERLRRQADSLRAAGATEAAARAAADERAAAARARALAADSATRVAEERAAVARAGAMAADSATRAAEQRAAEAERLRYAALLDLNRLISNVAEIRDTERGLAIVLGQGLFASGQSSLSGRARSEVGTIAGVLAQYPENDIAVEGHTDAVGTEVANQRLSEARAEAVRAALIARGVSPSKISMVGYGQGRPIADNATAEARARNRRVEIVILGARRPGGGE